MRQHGDKPVQGQADETESKDLKMTRKPRSKGRSMVGLVSPECRS